MARILSLLLAIAVMAQAPPPTQPVPQWTLNDRKAALLRTDRALDNYIDVDRVPAIRAYLATKKTKLLAIDDQQAFARALTGDLQAASHDKHFIVWYSEEADENQSHNVTPAEEARLTQFFQYVAQGYDMSARLKGNVGYLRLGGFANMPGAKTTIDAAMQILAATDALIIDLRTNGGGDSDTVDYLCGYFLAKRAEIAEITQRVDGRLSVSQEFTSADVGGSRYVDKPVYILVSKSTISGGEMFAYSLQSLHRATVIGSSTAGAANGLGTTPYFLSPHLRLSVPDTRIINPYTHANWEQGVTPDVSVSASDALLVAYTLALAHVPKSYDPLGQLSAALRDPAEALRDSLP
jgi:retinol-binding protein 3